MPTYRVVNVIGNVAGDQPRTEVQWYKGRDIAQAISALVQSACHGRDGDISDLPDSMRFRVHSVRLDIDHDDEPEGSTWWSPNPDSIGAGYPEESI